MADRRTLIGGVTAALFGSPFGAFAQQPAKIPRIGILSNNPAPVWDSFRRGLNELGYVDGRNIVLEWRWTEAKAERFPLLANELVQSKVDLIVTSSTQATMAAKQATSSIPIVMLNSVYPDKVGLVQSLARPGGNVTGFTNLSDELIGKKLQIVKELVPKASSVAVMWNASAAIEQIAFRDVTAAAAAVGVEIRSIEVRAPDELAAAFAAVTASRADALHVFGNPVNFKNVQPIADFALRSRLPSSFDERSFVAAGGLFSYGSSFADTYRRAATVIDKILKGANPGELPIQQPTTFELVLNLKTAKALGLTIPQSLLLRADEMIQ